MSILLPPTSLTWAAVPSLEPEQAWVPLLNWMGWRQLDRVPLIEASLKPVWSGWLGCE